MIPYRDATTILVVEDDPAARELYRQVLLAAGFRAIAVPDGLDALKILETQIPSLVVLDLILPRVGGVDVYRELRARPDTRNVPVVIVTGSDVRELEPHMTQGFLRKPISPDALVSAVQHAVHT